MDQIRGHREKHPSGKPRPRVERRTWGDDYANRDEPKTVRLRRDANTNAIGFTVKLAADDEE